MKKANVGKVETMMADFLQYRYNIYLKTEYAMEHHEKGRHAVKNPDLVYYEGACDLIQACGGWWSRFFKGDSEKEEDLHNPDMYSHVVALPSDDVCARLNIDAWK